MQLCHCATVQLCNWVLAAIATLTIASCRHPVAELSDCRFSGPGLLRRIEGRMLDEPVPIFWKGAGRDALLIPISRVHCCRRNMTAREHDAPAFRTVERELDRLVEHAMARLLASDVRVEDESARQYHYKNELLVWTYRFQTSWPVGSEIAQITVRLQFAEFDEPPALIKVEVRTVAEVFQVGQISRVRNADWRVVTLERLMADGVDAVVLDEIAAARKLLQASGVAPPSG
jgi:hypothetical protein